MEYFMFIYCVLMLPDNKRRIVETARVNVAVLQSLRMKN